jgi:hypothetical protein
MTHQQSQTISSSLAGIQIPTAVTEYRKVFHKLIYTCIHTNFDVQTQRFTSYKEN